MARRPNILLIQTDQHRFDCLGLAGNPVLRTPALDRLGSEGVVFDRAYVQSPLCMPSRASMFTGQYIRGHGVWTNGVPLSKDVPTLAGTLADNGYTTAAIGKLHLTPYGMPPRPAGTQPAFPESFDAWPTARNGFGDSYFGLQSLRLVLGHNKPAGHYGDWLMENHPEALARFGRDAAPVPPTGAPQSWRSALPVEWHSSTWIGNNVVRFLEDAARDRQPFFLWASFPDPHHPFAPPEPYASMYDPADVPLPIRRDGELEDKPDHFRRFAAGGVMHDGAYPDDVPAALTEDHAREIVAHTYGMISLVDHNVGRMLDTLDQTGLADDTIVIFTSDHGELLGDHGLILKGPFMYESLIRVPLLVRYPRCGAPGRRSAALAAHVDIFPTLAELAGVDPGTSLPGVSLTDILSDETPTARDAVMSEYNSGYWPELTLKTLVTTDWKLTFYPNTADGELYDLKNDPNEFTNLYHDPASGAVRRELVERLLAELVRHERHSGQKYAHA